MRQKEWMIFCFHLYWAITSWFLWLSRGLLFIFISMESVVFYWFIRICHINWLRSLVSSPLTLLSFSSFIRSFLWTDIDQTHKISIHLHLCHSNHTLISSATPLLKAFKIAHLPLRIYSDWCSFFFGRHFILSAIKVVADATASTNRYGFDRKQRRNNRKLFRFGFMLLFALGAFVTVDTLSATNKSNRSVSSQFSTVSMDV